jgi:hypothetical protein
VLAWQRHVDPKPLVGQRLGHLLAQHVRLETHCLPLGAALGAEPSHLLVASSTDVCRTQIAGAACNLGPPTVIADRWR